MSGRWSLATGLYRWLLGFYPAAFRAEFGEEMTDVFAMAVADIQRGSGKHTWLLLWRELRGWPGSVVRQHLWARRVSMTANRSSQNRPLLGSELLAAMIVFLLIPLTALVATSGIALPPWMNTVLAVLAWGSVAYAIGLAVVRKLPGWSLSYLGLALILGIIYGRYDRIWGWIYPVFVDSFGPRSLWPPIIRIIYTGMFEFVLSLSILLGAFVLVNLLRLLPYTRGVWRRMRADWTQLSFMFYGALLFGVQIMFEEYRHDDPWKFTAWIFLGLGAWLYLRATGRRQRFLALAGGATGALWTVALAEWVLIPLQAWPSGYPVSPSPVTRWVDTSSTLVAWVCVLAMLAAPALLKLLPPAPDPLISGEEDPVTVSA